MVKITKEFIKEYAYKTNPKATAINGSQCIIIGLDFKTDIQKGWLSKFEGIEVSNASAELFIRLSGLNTKEQKVEIENFKRERALLKKST